MRLRIVILTCSALITRPLPAAHLTAGAKHAFDAYIASVEREKPESMRVEPVNGHSVPLNGGLVHHWRGAAFVPRGKRENMLALLRDYNRLSSYYAPEVQSSRALSAKNGVTTLAIRLRKQKIVTAVFDAEYQVESGVTGDHGGFGISRSTHIWQINQPGTPRESRRPEGEDDGLLWRLNAYWTFLETADGLFIKCEAVSLTRDIPAGLAWLIQPIVEELPRASLISTLTATANAIRQGIQKENER